ncbi:MAG: aminoglycoside phosphotransferase, partial [Mesorhizobium sp.]
PSDATIDILSRQLQRKATPSTWRKVDADRKLADIVAELRRFSERDTSEKERSSLHTAS